MKEEIVKKLKLALIESIQKECQVIYIFVEIRKLLDWIDQDGSNFSVLRFYSNWVLHIKIDKTFAISSLLKKIENSILRGEGDRYSIILEMINFDELRKELKNILKQIKVNNFFSDDNYWQTFKEKLVTVLIDCPLEPKLGNIEKFAFTNRLNNKEISCEIIFKDGNTTKKYSFTFVDLF